MSLLAEINKQQHNTFRVYGYGNNWKVVNRLTDEVVDRFTDEDKAWELAGQLQAEDGKKQTDFYKASRGMMMGDVEMDTRSEEEETLKAVFKSKLNPEEQEPEIIPFRKALGLDD